MHGGCRIPRDRPAALAAALALTLGTALGSCRDVGPEHDVILWVEALEAPASVAADASLPVTLTVTLGGCHEYTRLEVRRPSGRLELTAWGRTPEGRNGIACPDITFPLEVEYAAPPPFTDPFMVAVRQPNGTTLEHVVRVE